MLRYPYETVPAPGETIEILPGLHWLQMPLPMALNHINLYLLEDSDGWWIVDTGMSIGPTQELWETIFSNVLGEKPVKAVLCTHMHPDHIGMAGWLCDKWKIPLYMTRGEYFSGRAFSSMQKEDFSWTSEQHLRRAGYNEEQIEQARENHGGFGSIISPMPRAFRRLCEGDSLSINGNRWRIVVGSGHSPEHASLYCESLNVLISGDQVIPRITSNVSVSGNEPEANPLQEWLDSHERYLTVLPSDALVLPAHNTPFYGLHERLRVLIEHHEEHLLALEQACVENGQTAFELLPVLFKRKLDPNHLGLALGECIAHLNYLFQRGQLSRTEDAEGHYRYRSVDETLAMRVREKRHEPLDDIPLQV
jgi:glyoxylase-like metal-dependent hydrolase (beta-lactamase superfamily II)